jgi:hypothetical protein
VPCIHFMVDMSLVEQELLNPPEHLSSPPVFSGVRVAIFSCMCMLCRSLFVLLYVFTVINAFTMTDMALCGVHVMVDGRALYTFYG